MEATKEMKDKFYIFYLENEVNKLQQEKQELIEWLEHLVTIGSNYVDGLGSSTYSPEYNRLIAYKEVLNKIKGSD